MCLPQPAAHATNPRIRHLRSPRGSIYQTFTTQSSFAAGTQSDFTEGLSFGKWLDIKCFSRKILLNHPFLKLAWD